MEDQWRIEEYDPEWRTRFLQIGMSLRDTLQGLAENEPNYLHLPSNREAFTDTNAEQYQHLKAAFERVLRQFKVGQNMN